jgi:hypothetical protein
MLADQFPISTVHSGPTDYRFYCATQPWTTLSEI